jgi:hypothetical protein
MAGGGGNDLFRSGVVEIVGIGSCVRDGVGVIEPVLRQFDVARYADCSDRYCLSELGILNQSSVSSSARPLDLDLDRLSAIGYAISSFNALRST